MVKIRRKKNDRNKSAKLSTEILITILMRLDLVDWLRAGRVCVSWRAAWTEMVTHNLHPPSHQLPFLIVSQENEHRVFNLSDGKVYGLHLSQACGARCLGSFDGWLILIDKIIGCFLLNVTSRVCIRLPRNSARHGLYMEHFWERLFTIDAKAILSSDPTSGDCTVVIACSGNKFAFYRVGDAAWTILKGEPNGYHSISDITFYNGCVLSVCSHMNELNIYELDPHPKSRKWKMLPRPEIEYTRSAFVRGTYLVESCGELLMVLRLYYHLVGLLRRLKRYKETFCVFKMDPNGSGWIEVESLGDQMIFLGYSKSLSTKGLSGFKRNCIYFTKDVFMNSGPGVFDLENGRTGWFPSSIPSNICYPPQYKAIWVTLCPKP